MLRKVFMRVQGMARAVLRLTLFLTLFAPGGANYYGDPQSDAQWVPSQMEVEHACLRPPCGQAWVAEPAEADIVCPVPHTSPVWFSGSVDWEQVGADLFFGALVGGDGVPTKTKTWKSADGKISKAKFSGGRVRGGVIAAGVLAGVSIWQNSDSAGYHCAACLWGEYSHVYWVDDTPNQNHTAHCRNNPLDETCVQLLQEWQEEEGKQVCTTCPPYTVPNSIMAPTYKWKRCYEDCSDAYNVMGGNWQTDEAVIEQLKSMGFKSQKEEEYFAQWSSVQALAAMDIDWPQNMNPERDHFVPVRNNGETTCQPCADGQTKFAFNWAELKNRADYVGVPYEFVYLGMTITMLTDPRMPQAERAHFHDFPIKFECRACPSGFVQYFKYRDEYRSHQTDYDLFGLGFSHAHFRCAVCPPQQGVAPWFGTDARVEQQAGGCQRCSGLRTSISYQKLGRNEIQLPITEYNTEPHRALLLPKECAECPLGFDRQLADYGLAAPRECREALRWPDDDKVVPQHPWNFHSAENTPVVLAADEGLYEARAARVRNGCCSACGVNQKRGSADRMGCVAIEPREGTTAVYGNSVAVRCERGQDLLYCPLFVTEMPCVRNQIADLNSHWRTCWSCSQTMRVVTRNEAGSSRFWCEECIGSVANLARATGEFRSDTDGSRCESCSGCSYLQVTRGMEDVDVPLTPEGNSEAAKDKYLIEQHTQGFSGGFRRPKIESPNLDLSMIPFKTLSVQVECVPLPRRYLSESSESSDAVESIKVFGSDMYKVRKTAADETDPFAVVYELFKLVTVPVGFAVRYGQNLDCTLLSCYEVCDAPFQYADRCGPRTIQNDVYVEGGRFVLKFEEAVERNYMRGSNLYVWRVRHEGYCRPCQSCEDDYYTKGCNDLESDFPGGTCAPCSVTCEVDQYKWHKLGPEGCKARYAGGIRKSRRPQSPYECRPCPRWIKTDGTENERNQQELRIVASCGQARAYVYWNVSNGEYVVDSRQGTASEYAIGETLPFCPPGRFYNEDKAGCALNRDLSEFAQEYDLNQGFDELTQQQLDSCCVRCEECEVDIARPADSEKTGPGYVKCSGATLTDTQSNQCVRKCPFGTHESNQTCVRCQECFVGESLSRNS